VETSQSRSFHRALSVLCVVPLAGCANIGGRPALYQNTQDVIKVDKPYLSADVRNNAAANTKDYRDRVIYARLEVIELNYDSFESNLMSVTSSTSLAADLSVLVLNGLGATTGSSAAKAAFAAASAGVVGAKGAINTDIFYQKTIPALIAQMRADRAKALLVIALNQKKTIEEYSLQQALTDINAVYVAGTLPSALTSITSQAGTQLTQSTDELAEVRKGKWVSPGKGSTAEQILYWLYPGGDETKPINSANLQSLTNWMNNYKADPILANISYQDLLTNGKVANAEADRQQAIKDLTIPKVTP
jgi:hypothetical protein